jgi:hypothetical protein
MVYSKKGEQKKMETVKKAVENRKAPLRLKVKQEAG